MKKSALVIAASLAAATASVVPTQAFADDAASPITYNIGAVTDYLYRGISQTRFKPALQGGVDWAQGPFYLGTWLSTISWIKDDGHIAGGTTDTGKTPLEWDLYGGTRGDIIKDSLTYDVGVLGYLYVGNKFKDASQPSANTGEVYGSLIAGIYTAKVSLAFTPLFGAPDSRWSSYTDLSANYDLGGGFSLTPDVAYQDVTGNFNSRTASYVDYSLTLGKDFGKGLSASLQIVATDAKKADYQTSDAKFTGRTGVVAGVKYTF
jgi:uncharacterized protein (TIGR02001 family)